MQKISSEQTYCIKYIASAWLKLFQKNFNTNNGFTVGEEDALYHNTINSVKVCHQELVKIKTQSTLKVIISEDKFKSSERDDRTMHLKDERDDAEQHPKLKSDRKILTS